MKTISFPKSALAATAFFMTSAQSYTEGTDTTNNSSEHEEVNSLIAEIPSSDPVLIDRASFNNFRRLPEPENSVAKATSVIHLDNRIMVPLSEELYDPVGRIRSSVEFCTGTIVEIAGYTSENPLVWTAGHCPNKVTAESILFETIGVDTNGEPFVYQSQVLRSEIIFNNMTDIGLLELAEPLPPELKPALLIPNYNFDINMPITIAGYPSDRLADGLTAHFNCYILGQAKNNELISYLGTYSNCDVSSGASGSPVIIDQRDRLIIGGTISGVIISPDSAWSLLFKAPDNFFNNVDFIKRDDEKNCVAASVSNTLNVRTGMGTEFQRIAFVNNGDVMQEIINLGEWSNVKLESGIQGFVANEFTTPTPC